MSANSKTSIAIVYRSDAHKKATKPIEKGLVDNGYPVDSMPLGKYDISDLAKKVLSNYKVVIMSCGGRDINQIIQVFSNIECLSKTISLFPGIVVNEQLEAFITRLKCDHVLLNSRSDVKTHKKICKLFKRSYNGILFGAPWYDFNRERDHNYKSTSPCTVFFEQTNVPYLEKDRYHLARSLVSLARRNPNRIFLIKERLPYNKTNLSSISSLISKLTPPGNLSISNKSVPNLLDKSDSCLSVSSSALVEAILLKKNVYIISDYMKLNNYTKFYSGSGLLTKINKIDFSRSLRIHNTWLYKNIINPNRFLPKLLEIIDNQSDTKFVTPLNINLIALYLHFPSVALFNPFSIKRKVSSAVSIVNESHE